MTSLLLLSLLGLSPGVQLADSWSHRGASLLDGKIRLVDDEERTKNLDRMNKTELEDELAYLKTQRSTLVGPIILLSGGVALTLLSIVFFALESGGGLLVAYGVVALIAGVGLAATGGIILAVRLIRRGVMDAQIQDLRNRIDRADPANAPNAPDAPPPPPPPPPPPGANFVTPGPGLLVAVF
jgi:hypothetical protein